MTETKGKQFFSSLKKTWLGPLIFLLLLFSTLLEVHPQSFKAVNTPFSSSVADEFAPVFYKNGLVYCSNDINNPLVSIKSESGNLYNMVFAERKDSTSWKAPVLFSEELTTILNEGPATFSPDGKTIFYARNIQTKGKLRQINDPSNTLGIYSAELVEGKWSNISSFEFNSESYSVGTPAMSADGNRLFFASDKPGGFGGTDLYYCEKKNNSWGEPVNLGPVINSEYNESYPFINAAGRFFFASDKPGGNGGKDIYYSLEINGQWLEPIHLDEEINSRGDDFGLITDKNFEWGYFSSNRKSGTNIYSFETLVPQFDVCASQETFSKCFDFYDDRFTDTLHLEYEWDFGHGNKLKGIKVRKCFDKPGNYTAVLTIIHHLADCTFSTKYEYDFKIRPDKNTFIYTNRDIILDQPVNFQVMNKKGNESRHEYLWDFGQGFNRSGQEIQYSFSNTGEHQIKLGIIKKNDNGTTQLKECLRTTVYVYSDYLHLAEEKYPLIAPPGQKDNEKLYKSGSSPNYYLVHTYLLADMKPALSDSLATVFSSFPDNYISFNDNGEPTVKTQKKLEQYISILKLNPKMKLIIAIHQNNKGSKHNNEIKTEQAIDGINMFFNLHGIQKEFYECTGYGSRPLTNKVSNEAPYKNKRVDFIFVNYY